jgi:bifunctional DNase/RNase
MTEIAEQFVRMTVADVRAEAPGGEWLPRHVVILREVDGERTLPIWIGPSEARHIAFASLGEPTQRPMTYALMRNLLDAAGGRISEVRVTALTDHVFIAAVLVTGPAGIATVDARASDAINIALEACAPIYASRALLDHFAAADAFGGSDAVKDLRISATDIVSAAREQQRQALARIVDESKRHRADTRP